MFRQFRCIAFSLTATAIIAIAPLGHGREQIPAHPNSPVLSAPVTYFISDGSGRAGYRTSDRELALWALQAWQRAIGKEFRVESAPESDALIRLYWVEPNSGTYGEMRPVIVGGRQGAAVYIQPDVQSLGPEIASRVQGDQLLRDAIVYLTCLHELGHALGLDHTHSFADIMYYFGYGGDVGEYFNRYRSQLRSRNDIAANAGLSASDISRIREIYGRK